MGTEISEDIHVRGHRSFNRPATRTIRFFSTLLDLFIILFITTYALSYLHITPLPRFGVFSLLALIGLLYWFPQRILFGITAGEKLWQLRARKTDRYRLREVLYQCDHIAVSSILTSILITLSVLTATGFAFKNTILQSPLWTPASLWRLTPYAPNTDDWVIAPFFYTIGGWPKKFAGKPIFYTLVYEKGPPTRFIGHIFANWSVPDIKVIFEGPKTPEKSMSQDEIKDCILRKFSYQCLAIREGTLARHMDQIALISPESWTMKWFIVENPMIPPEDQVQGVYLSAVGENWIQDRFIIVSSNGTHQAIILNRSKGPQGNAAFALMQNAIQSMRSFNELNSGRAWVNRELEEIRLDDLHLLKDSTRLIARLAEIQSLLISRISVDPGSYDSYFHLAGTSLMLAKNSIKTRDGLSVIALQNLQSAYRYATDIAPKDPRTAHIQDLWIESNKH
jgi:hypothetical protein